MAISKTALFGNPEYALSDRSYTAIQLSLFISLFIISLSANFTIIFLLLWSLSNAESPFFH